MREGAELVWKGERNRQLNVYRVCPCGVCQGIRRGVGYLSFSDANGRGFTIWIEDEMLFRGLKRALRDSRKDYLNNERDALPKGGTDAPENLRAVCTNCNEGLQNISPPKPDRIELLKQVRRATIEDQIHLLEWLENKYAKVRPRK